MNDDADRWVVISALVVLGIYAYRRLVEPVSSGASVKQLVGIGNPVKLGAFITAWGFTYLVVSLIATADAGLGKGFALLIMTGDLLANGQQIASDVTKKVGSSTASTVSSTQSTTTGPAATVSGPGSPSTPSMFTDPFSGFPTIPDPLLPAGG